MKVGVYLADIASTGGGGFTFQDDVFQSLIELAEESKHTYIVFCHPKCVRSIRAASESNRIQVIAYPPPNLPERIISRVSLEITVFRKFWKRASRMERVVREAGVEFMWFVIPAFVQMQLPYLTIVWDLQHRLQPWFPEVSEGEKWDTREIYYAHFLRRASVIIAGTEVGRKEIERFYQVPAERIKVLPHPTPGFALNAPPGDGKEVLDKYEIPNGYLFYPAQFWSHKNHANLLLAVKKLRDEYRLVLPVVFVGSEKGNQAYIRGLVNELHLSTQVHFLGLVSSRDLVSLYRNAFALTYVTFFGPENLPPLEAFALGCPVVASNVAGAQEQLGEAALLVDPRSPEEIAGAIKSLYDDLELRKAFVERGFERAQRWTGRDFVRGVFSILDEFEPVRRCWTR